ncbi:hypothetical protein FISHEDRAFT_69274 [Fistulina hepatica ATCC 64428]|uniref:Uncharacterized protein n=1 Tax=Fistulina hepatica ATCC 64428 TaxID=1128425 RepID=A0A0D7ANH1_9AGAR|nr:hypothetical protein FISHEDRAFT_69274 [Fistulina hepatica ATCC 64428]
MSSRSAPQKSSSLVALPSVSSSLHSLPRAGSMANVALHADMYNYKRGEESKAKVRQITHSALVIVRNTYFGHVYNAAAIGTIHDFLTFLRKLISLLRLFRTRSLYAHDAW